MNPALATALLVIGLVVSNVVHAHIGIHAEGSFETGLMHPFSGADHMLAMIAVGMWAAQSGLRTLVTIPATFVAAMVLGAALGATGVALPFAEEGIAASVLMMGLLITFAVRGSWEWAVPLVAVLALFHGYAHGVSLPAFSNPWRYFAGFLLATIVLHASGIVGAVILRSKANALRAGGLAISMAGMWFILSL